MTEEEKLAFGIKDGNMMERHKQTEAAHHRMGKMSILNHYIAEDIEQVMKENFEDEQMAVKTLFNRYK